MERVFKRLFAGALVIGAAAVLSACGGGGGGGGGGAGVLPIISAPAPVVPVAPESPAAHSVGGTVSGLAGKGLVLQNNAGDDITPSADGRFFFPARLASGAAYAVTVRTQPSSPVQTCSVSKGTGTMGSVDVDNIVVVCSTEAFKVSGTVSGMLGIANPVALRNNGGDEILLPADGPFEFPAAVADGAGYAVTVSTQPTNPPLVCTVNNASGVISAAPVSNVAVVCSLQAFTVGGSVSGLDGQGLVLQNNAGDDLTIAEDGTFTFSTPVVAGATYAVSVKTQPKLIDQVCTVIAGSGTVATGNVTDVDVACASNPARRAFIGTYPSSTDPGFQSWPVDATGAPVESNVVTTAFPGVKALAVNEARKKLYVLDASGYLSVYDVLPDYSLNLAGGLATSTAGTLMALDPLGRSIFILNPTNGHMEAHLLDGAGIPDAGTWPTNLGMTHQTTLVFDAAGSFLYAASTAGDAIQVVPVLSDGVTTSAATSFATGAFPSAIAIDISGKYLYSANTNDNSVSRFLIDASTGALSGRIDYGSPGAMVLAMHPNGTNLLVGAWSVTARVDTYAIAAADGMLTAAGSLATTSTRIPMSLTFDPAGRSATLVTQDMLETLSVQPNGTAAKRAAYPQISTVRLSSAFAWAR